MIFANPKSTCFEINVSLSLSVSHSNSSSVVASQFYTHQFHVALRIHHQILGLQVPIDNVARVQVFDSLDDAADDKLSDRFGELFVLLQLRPDIAAQARLHQEVDVLCVAERLEESGEP